MLNFPESRGFQSEHLVSDECFHFIEFPLRLFLLITNPSTSRVTKTFSDFSCDDSEGECKGSLIM